MTTQWHPWAWHRYCLLAQGRMLIDQHVHADMESVTNSFSCAKNNNKHVEGTNTECIYVPKIFLQPNNNFNFPVHIVPNTQKRKHTLCMLIRAPK